MQENTLTPRTIERLSEAAKHLARVEAAALEARQRINEVIHRAQRAIIAQSKR